MSLKEKTGRTQVKLDIVMKGGLSIKVRGEKRDMTADNHVFGVRQKISLKS